MTKADLIAQVAEKAQSTKSDAERIFTAVFDVIQATLEAEGKVSLVGFGTFTLEQRAERKGRNPQTGAEITIPASKAVKFHAGKALKDRFAAK